jgi:hypothetical protein
MCNKKLQTPKCNYSILTHYSYACLVVLREKIKIPSTVFIFKLFKDDVVKT